MFPWNTLFSSHKNQNNFLKNLQNNDVQSFIDKVFEEAMPKNIQETMDQTAPVKERFQQAQVLSAQSRSIRNTFIYLYSHSN